VELAIDVVANNFELYPHLSGLGGDDYIVNSVRSIYLRSYEKFLLNFQFQF